MCFCVNRSVKHVSSSAPTTASSTGPSTAGRSPSPHPAKATKQDAPPKEKKEKKRSEPSSSRQKTFHRHFQQVAADEHVVNCESYLFLSDLLTSWVEINLKYILLLLFRLFLRTRQRYSAARPPLHYQQLFCILFERLWVRHETSHSYGVRRKDIQRENGQNHSKRYWRCNRRRTTCVRQFHSTRSCLQANA